MNRGVQDGNECLGKGMDVEDVCEEFLDSFLGENRMIVRVG